MRSGFHQFFVWKKWFVSGPPYGFLISDIFMDFYVFDIENLFVWKVALFAIWLKTVSMGLHWGSTSKYKSLWNSHISILFSGHNFPKMLIFT